ncbi:hypothetical protein [Streptacidiphilus carbonis]|jgi:hypothetical protein|uniref:hypothetical protein n=1 Tax=Streptacidiphilus carbonis TaxID=105422 RepID=UPI0005AB0EA7|nr:hypothetical protein [Streptacidiphilus carbonis]
MPIDASEAIPLLAQIHTRAREQKQELWELALRAFQAGAAPASIARVMGLGLNEAEIGHLEQSLAAASDVESGQGEIAPASRAS